MVHKINYEFLEENDNYDNANIELEASRVAKSMDNFLSRNIEKKYGMIGYVGSFGCGKSSVINKVKSQDKSSNNEWLQFDAWKYPDRKELWDGFVLDIVSRLGESSRKDITETIETGLTKKEQKANTVIDLLSSAVNWVKFDTGSGASLQLNVPNEVKGFFKNAGSKILRIEEYQSLLLAYFIELSKKFYDGKIYIVIEDIDRGNIEEGLTFLETLRYFLSIVWNNYLGTLIKIIPIILIDKDSFEKNEYQKRFIKIFDKIIYSEIKYDWIGFLDELIGGIKFEERSFFSGCITSPGILNKSTPREIKSILRSLLCSYQPSSKHPEFCSVILVQLTIMYLSSKDRKINYGDTVVNIKGILEQHSDWIRHPNQNNDIAIIGRYFDDQHMVGALAKYFIDGYDHDLMNLHFVGSTPSGDIEIAKGSIQCKFPITLLNN